MKSSEEIVDITIKINEEYLIDLDPMEVLQIAVLMQTIVVNAVHKNRSIADIVKNGF